jgi:hypothetical protein
MRVNYSRQLSEIQLRLYRASLRARAPASARPTTQPDGTLPRERLQRPQHGYRRVQRRQPHYRSLRWARALLRERWISLSLGRHVRRVL